MTTLTLLSLLVAATYLLTAVVKYRAIPDSLSALVYVLPQGRWRWLWSLWLAVVTLLTAPALMQATSASWWSSLLAAATIVCLAMTAALPLLPGYHNRLHNALGIAAGILSQLCVAVVCPWWLMAWVLLVGIGIDGWRHIDDARWYDHKGVLLAELLCAATVYASLLASVP